MVVVHDQHVPSFGFLPSVVLWRATPHHLDLSVELLLKYRHVIGRGDPKEG